MGEFKRLKSPKRVRVYLITLQWNEKKLILNCIGGRISLIDQTTGSENEIVLLLCGSKGFIRRNGKFYKCTKCFSLLYSQMFTLVCPKVDEEGPVRTPAVMPNHEGPTSQHKIIMFHHDNRNLKTKVRKKVTVIFSLIIVDGYVIIQTFKIP